MATRIPKALNDSSSAGIKLTVKDTDGAAVDSGGITSITYRLSDKNGTPINERSAESVIPANPVTIPITAADSEVSESDEVATRLLTVTWVYNDPNLGDGVEHAEEFFVSVNNFKNKPATT
ncbi:MAG: hypothetical protein KKA54_13165 [Proteobacteria bacterium]|nr:hypothetical protein [Pseudomonadota bacterium]